jgi:hypothetical protein
MLESHLHRFYCIFGLTYFVLTRSYTPINHLPAHAWIPFPYILYLCTLSILNVIMCLRLRINAMLYIWCLMNNVDVDILNDVVLMLCICIKLCTVESSAVGYHTVVAENDTYGNHIFPFSRVVCVHHVSEYCSIDKSAIDFPPVLCKTGSMKRKIYSNM